MKVDAVDAAEDNKDAAEIGDEDDAGNDQLMQGFGQVDIEGNKH